MADTEDWAMKRARKLYQGAVGSVFESGGTPDEATEAISSALRDARREGIEAAVTHVEEHHYQDARLLAGTPRPRSRRKGEVMDWADEKANDLLRPYYRGEHTEHGFEEVIAAALRDARREGYAAGIEAAAQLFDRDAKGLDNLIRMSEERETSEHVKRWIEEEAAAETRAARIRALAAGGKDGGK